MLANGRLDWRRKREKGLPDPRRISWNPALGKRYDLRPSLGRLFNDFAGLLDRFGEIEPCGFMLRDRNANGISSAGHGFQNAGAESDAIKDECDVEPSRRIYIK
jgi:hypothetical protein